MQMWKIWKCLCQKVVAACTFATLSHLSFHYVFTFITFPHLPHFLITFLTFITLPHSRDFIKKAEPGKGFRLY